MMWLSMYKIQKKWQKKKILEPSKFVGFKVNMQKSVPFPYTASGQAEFEIKNTIYISTPPKWKTWIYI